MSAMALSRAAPARSALLHESPALRSLNPSTHYVTLPQLAIMREQIVEGAIGESELADGELSADCCRRLPLA